MSNRIKKSNSIARIEFNRTELTCVRLTMFFTPSAASTLVSVWPKNSHPPQVDMKNSIMLTLGAAIGGAAAASASVDARASMMKRETDGASEAPS